jgi:hypothetical protein
MHHRVTNSDELVLTQAQQVPPPGVTVPEPPESTPAEKKTVDPTSSMLRDIRTLADRAGGLEKLRDLITELIQF